MKNTISNSLIKDIAVKDINVFPSEILHCGLTKKQVESSLNKYGPNYIDGKKDDILSRLKRAFINPYSIVLFILDIISLFTEVIFAKEANFATFSIITTMLLASGLIRFYQELKAKKITDELTKLIDTSIMVKRDNELSLIDFEDLVVGDLVILKAGQQVPADIRLTKVNDLFVSQSMITGESGIEEKNIKKLLNVPKKISDYKNIIFQGTTIVSGSSEGIVISTGNNTLYGGFSSSSINKKSGYDKGANSIIWVLIKFMAFLIPLVFVASGLTKGDWLNAFLFSLSVAVGLTPELLPMVITSCLAFGSSKMSKKQTLVKNINAMKEFGSMDVLCVDKTGTLTKDKLLLEYYMDVLGNESSLTLDYGYLNSYFSSSMENHIDQAILLAKTMNNKEFHLSSLVNEYQKLDERPFDYTRKISSVLLKNNEHKIIISKGNLDNIIKNCTHIQFKNKVIKIKDNSLNDAHAIVDEMSEEGMKVLAISYKETNKHTLENDDEKDMILIGYLCFFDSPKSSAFKAIYSLKEQNVNTKVLTGDNKKVTISICKRLGMDYKHIITGDELDNISINDLPLVVERNQIFCELTPKQKSDIVTTLQTNGHTVGFLGDGMNDLHAMTNANVGISVENAAPSLKEVADVVLLKKDLNVLKEGIIEGRKSFNNMNKYIKITASSNLGNILSIVIASIFLPFFPMTSIQILLLNLLYDVLCLVLPWDNVDDEMCKEPLEFTGNKLNKFMLFFGPISSIFDVITFCFLLFYLCPQICGGSFYELEESGQSLFISIFQTGWFLESMWTQVLILHLLRTNKVPLIQSRPSKVVVLTTLFGILIFTVLAMTPLGKLIGLTTLPFIYFIFLIGIVIVYLLLVTYAKKIYLKKNKSLL